MNFLNRKPREIGRLRTEYSPPEALHAAKAVDSLRDIPPDPGWIDLQEQIEVTRIPHLDEIKVHLRQLTWAEMQEYCAGTNSDPKTVHDWSQK
jgi:hypothetical protein